MFRFVAIGIGILVLVGAALSGSYVFDAYLVSPDAGAVAETFEVPEGEAVPGTVKRLADEEFVNSKFFFKIYLRLSGLDRSFQTGTFSLTPGSSYSAIAKALTNADRSEMQITVPEGFTLTQIGERVREALPQITEEDWNAAVSGSTPVSTANFFVGQNKPPGVDLEGYLFPDTYRFFADATAQEIVTKMVETMEAKLGGALATVADENGFSKPGALTPHQVLTLASIIEREVRGAEDMKYVADIFLSRLEIGMPLQADSTISYYLGKTSAELTVEDLKADEPFNTYTRAGLPPGPISNPGMNAIDAVLNPIANPYLYFLTTTDGTVIYASTFEEHVANKNRYLR